MRMFGKVLVSAAALAFAGGLSLGAVQAAPVTGKVSVSSQLDLVAAKKKKEDRCQEAGGQEGCREEGRPWQLRRHELLGQKDQKVRQRNDQEESDYGNLRRRMAGWGAGHSFWLPLAL